MLKIDERNIKKIVEINNLMNQISVIGIYNAKLVSKVGDLIQEFLLDLDKLNSDEIVIDNTKKGG